MRLEVVSQEMVHDAVAAEGEEEKFLYTRGVFPHPGETRPRPSPWHGQHEVGG